MSKLEIGNKTYDAVLDDNGEAVQLSTVDEKSGVCVTLCFDNTSDGRASDDVLKSLKRKFLKSVSL